MADLCIGSIPDIFPAACHFAEFFYHIPVLIPVKFIAVSPDIEKILELWQIKGKKFFRMFEQSVVMVTGRIPFIEILRMRVFSAVRCCSGIMDAKGGKKCFYFMAVGTIRISMTADDFSGSVLPMPRGRLIFHFTTSVIGQRAMVRCSTPWVATSCPL